MAQCFRLSNSSVSKWRVLRGTRSGPGVWGETPRKMSSAAAAKQPREAERKVLQDFRRAELG